jgi:hypothetical protein
MAYFRSTESKYEIPPSQDTNKRLSTLLGTNKLLAKVRALPPHEIGIYKNI